MKKTIATLALGFGLLATSCASNLPQIPAQERENATVEEAMKVLGIQNPNEIKDINGYKMLRETSDHVRNYAEMHTKKQMRNRMRGRGVENIFQNPIYQEAIERILWNMDKLGEYRDMIITPEEEKYYCRKNIN